MHNKRSICNNVVMETIHITGSSADEEFCSPKKTNKDSVL